MPRRRLGPEWAATLVLGTAHGAQHFLSGLLPPLIPVLAVVLQYPLWQLGLLVSLYSLVGGLGQAPMGVLADRHDRRYILPAGIGLMAAGYVVFGLAPGLGAGLPILSVAGASLEGTFLVMAAGMAVTGAGSSAVHPTGYPLVTANVRDGRKGRAMGIWGSASKFGDTLAPLAVAALLLLLAWEQVLLVLGGAGAAYAVALAAGLGREGIETGPPAAVAAADEDEADGDGPDGEARDVLDDRRAFLYPMVAVVLFFVARGVATKGVRTFVPTFVTDVYGYSLTVHGTTVGLTSLANVYFSALLFTAAIVQLLAGELTDRWDHRKVIVGMFSLATVGLVALSFVHLSPLALLLALLDVGGSIWGANPARDTLVSDISPALVGYVADLTSIQNSFRYLALATLLAAGCAALLLSPRVYVERGATSGAGSD